MDICFVFIKSINKFSDQRSSIKNKILYEYNNLWNRAISNERTSIFETELLCKINIRLSLKAFI